MTMRRQQLDGWRSLRVAWWLVCAGWIAYPVAGDIPNSSSAVPPDSAEQWLEKLGAPLFRQRQEAMRRLTDLGLQALPHVEQAAQSSDAEVRSRALAILLRHFGSESEELRREARAVLERLAKGDGPVARLADAILNPPPEPSPLDIQKRLLALQLAQAGRANGAVVPIFMGQVQVGAKGAQAIANRSVAIHEAGGRKVRIQQSGDSIKIEWSEPAGNNGKELINRAEARNVDELRRQHPEAYKVYEQYAPRFGLPLAKKRE